MIIPLVLVISLALLIISYVFIKSKSGKSSWNHPPSPPKLPIIGNLHQLGRLPHQSLYQLSQKYGPTMLLQLGSIPTLVISSPEMARQILKIHDLDFCNRTESSPGARKMTYHYSDLTFSSYNDHWKERRKIFSSELLNSKRSLSLWKFTREVVMKKMVESLSKKNETINFDEKIFQLVGEIITSVAFGKSYREYQFEDQKRELKQILDEAMYMIQSFYAEDFFPSIVGKIIDSLSGNRRRLNNCFARLDSYFEMVLQDHIDKQERSKGDLQEDLVDILIRLSKDQTGFHLSKSHMKAMCLNTLLGGVDTIAVTVVWTMAELIRNKRVMKKLQEEIRSTIGKKEKLEQEDIAKLKYLKMVIKETFRLHPAAPLMVPRTNIRHCKIEGYDICPKTKVLVNAYAIGRDPYSWNNPDEYYPERFEDNEVDFKGNHFQLLPFGSGRRVCPGASMSSNVIEFILANQLYFFDWKLPEGIQVEDVSLEEDGGLTIHKKMPLYLKPIIFTCQD